MAVFNIFVVLFEFYFLLLRSPFLSFGRNFSYSSFSYSSCGHLGATYTSQRSTLTPRRTRWHSCNPLRSTAPISPCAGHSSTNRQLPGISPSACSSYALAYTQTLDHSKCQSCRRLAHHQRLSQLQLTTPPNLRPSLASLLDHTSPCRGDSSAATQRSTGGQALLPRFAEQRVWSGNMNIVEGNGRSSNIQ